MPIKLLRSKSASSYDKGYLATDIWLKSACEEDEGDADFFTMKGRCPLLRFGLEFSAKKDTYQKRS